MLDDPVPRPHLSDLTDEQRALVEPMVLVKTSSRPAIHSRRRIVDTVLYVNRTGCAWRLMPHNFPPGETMYWQRPSEPGFSRWQFFTLSTGNQGVPIDPRTAKH